MAVAVFGLKQLTQQQLAKVKALGDISPVLRRMALRLTEAAKDRIEERRLGDVATGNLGNSLRTETQLREGAVFTNLPYAGVQQRGGRITPIPPKKNLAIPQQRYLRKDGLWPRDFAKGALEWRPSKKVAGLLYEKDSGKLAYVLVPAVTIPNRGPFLKIEAADIDAFRSDLVRYTNKLDALLDGPAGGEDRLGEDRGDRIGDGGEG